MGVATLNNVSGADLNLTNLYLIGSLTGVTTITTISGSNNINISGNLDWGTPSGNRTLVLPYATTMTVLGEMTDMTMTGNTLTQIEGGNLIISGNGAMNTKGWFEVASGATVTFAGGSTLYDSQYVMMGYGPSASSTNTFATITVTDDAAIMNTGNNILIGGNNGASGNGMLNVEGSGLVYTTGSLQLASRAANSGIVNQLGGSVSTPYVWYGNTNQTGGSGIYNLDGGNLTVGLSGLYIAGGPARPAAWLRCSISTAVP